MTMERFSERLRTAGCANDAHPELVRRHRTQRVFVDLARDLVAALELEATLEFETALELETALEFEPFTEVVPRRVVEAALEFEAALELEAALVLEATLEFEATLELEAAVEVGVSAALEFEAKREARHVAAAADLIQTDVRPVIKSRQGNGFAVEINVLCERRVGLAWIPIDHSQRITVVDASHRRPTCRQRSRELRAATELLRLRDARNTAEVGQRRVPRRQVRGVEREVG